MLNVRLIMSMCSECVGLQLAIRAFGRSQWIVKVMSRKREGGACKTTLWFPGSVADN